MKMFDYAERLKNLPFYLYTTVETATDKALKSGLDIIDLSTGDPEFPTPGYIIEELRNACLEPSANRYGNIQGYLPFRESIARWYKERFDVDLDSEKEVITFVGAKEGIAFFPLAFINRGDIALIPDPGYPTYRYAAAFAGAELKTFPIRPENHYVPDFDEIPEAIAKKARIMFLNYPNNPTAATVDRGFFKRAVQFAKKYNIIICHDAAYSEILFDGYKAPSFLEVDGAKEIGMEFHTLSKTFNMTGWRVGFGVGNREIIEALLEVKKVTSTGYFAPIEIAGMEALNRQPLELDKNNRKFQERRDFVLNKLNGFGIDIEPPRGSFYIWFPIPNEKDSLSFVTNIILQTGVVTFPGIGYGENGEGYIRIAVVKDLPRIEQAFKRLEPYL